MWNDWASARRQVQEVRAGVAHHGRTTRRRHGDLRRLVRMPGLSLRYPWWTATALRLADGDSAAAYRYTECRWRSCRRAARELGKKTVDFRPIRRTRFEPSSCRRACAVVDERRHRHRGGMAHIRAHLASWCGLVPDRRPHARVQGPAQAREGPTSHRRPVSTTSGAARIYETATAPCGSGEYTLETRTRVQQVVITASLRVNKSTLVARIGSWCARRGAAHRRRADESTRTCASCWS